jgi:ribonucleoside-diphosphate reductase alpha chain
VLAQGARLCRATNRLIAGLIGIRPAARICTTKPEGTASLILNAASGIHPHHARRYFRRVQANRKEPVYAFFHSVNPHMTEASVYSTDTDDVITFPVEAPSQAILRKDLNACQFLELVKLVQQSWVLAGAADDTRSPEVTHNVSNTCTVRPDEWNEVADFIWENRSYFTGIALLQDSGDKAYPQAPREEVLTEADISRWNSLRPQRVDYSRMLEDSDETQLRETVACAGGACKINRPA